MANPSLSSGHFPDIWKEGLVRPKLKKVNMDLIKKNCRPVSNLALLSKITEKAAALQISDHVSCNQMFPEFQSAYRKYHSFSHPAPKAREKSPGDEVELFVMALIKTEILTSRKVLYAKSCRRNQFLFCKKMLSKIQIFLS